MTEPYYQDDRVTLYHGDCLEVLDGLVEPVDAVLTDPPYASGTRLEAAKPSSGAMLRAGRFAGRPLDLDQMTTLGYIWLLRSIAMGVRQLMPDGASLMVFIDWRQWPHLVGALETANFRVQTMVVWDKGSIGTGNGFRSQHELICHASRGVPTIHDRTFGNVLRFHRQAPLDHPSPKPVGLLESLVQVTTPPAATVFDPFAGGGSTLVAARNLGRKAVGVEIEERYCEIAARRLAQDVLPLEVSR